MKKEKKTTTVKTLNNFLIILLALTVLMLGAIIYFSFVNLVSSADATKQAISKLQAENIPLENIEEVSQQNAAYADILTIYPSLTVDINDAQTNLTKDVNKYALLTNINITNTTYPKPSQEAGLQSTVANQINIQSDHPVFMNSILQFIKLIENNLPAMHVTEISLEGSGEKVLLKSITIEVDTR